MASENIIRLGTRGSELARWQTEHIQSLLEAAWPGKRFEIQVFTTRGDVVLETPLPLIGGKGLFTAELEAALREGVIDLAVHSLKDLPTESPEGLIIGAVPTRAAVTDVLVSRAGHMLESLPDGASVGTSSTRRAAQLVYHRPHLKLLDLRGNVPTRVRKALDAGGPYDAVVLARAGLERLGLGGSITQELAVDLMLPAPGQGALAVQCRDEADSRALLEPLNDGDTLACVTAERAFLAGLGGGCAVPVAAYAHLADGYLHLRGRVIAPDGSRMIDVRESEAYTGLPVAQALGAKLAQAALMAGAGDLLEGPA